MCRLIETIRIFKGKLMHLDWHQMRVQNSLSQLLPDAPVFDLQSNIHIPEFAKKGTYKCRIIYGRGIESIEYTAYRKKTIKKLILKEAPDLNYAHKFADRTNLEKLKQDLPADCEILITRQGKITDTSYANVAFFDGEKWWSPATPLLPGTCRARLIAEGKISLAEIDQKDLKHFQKIRIFNAMTGWKKAWEIGKLGN